MTITSTTTCFGAWWRLSTLWWEKVQDPQNKLLDKPPATWTLPHCFPYPLNHSTAGTDSLAHAHLLCPYSEVPLEIPPIAISYKRKQMPCSGRAP